MTNQDIKNEFDKLREEIRIANSRIERLRKLCKHERVYRGQYSWRPGSFRDAFICEYCGLVNPECAEPDGFSYNNSEQN